VRQGKKEGGTMFTGSVRLAVQLYKLYSLEKKKNSGKPSERRTYYEKTESSDFPQEGSHYYNNGWGYNNTPSRWGKR
jgi:hypothetical protein